MWIERIAGGGESSVIIEEGRVKQAAPVDDPFAPLAVECDEPLTDEF